MKLTIEKTALSGALKLVKPLAKGASTLPILSCVLLSVADGTLTLTTTDLDTGLELRLPCAASEDGSLAVSASRLSALVDQMCGEDIALETVRGALVLKSGSDEAKLMTLAAAEFPAMSKPMKLGEKMEFSCGELAAAIRKVLPFISQEEARYVLNGVYFENTKEADVVLVATDGRRLAKVILEDRGEQVAPFIAPACALRRLAALDVAEPVTLRTNESQLVADGGTWRLVAKLIEGNYPNFAQVIPTIGAKAWRLTLEPKSTAAAVAFLRGVQPKPDAAVTLAEVGGVLELQAKGPEIGEALRRLDAKVPTGMLAAFNGQFFAQAAEMFGGSPVEMAMNDAASGALFTAEGALVVLMPLRVS